MKVGDLVKIKNVILKYEWRVWAAGKTGIITGVKIYPGIDVGWEYTQVQCVVDGKSLHFLPCYLEVINESR